MKCSGALRSYFLSRRVEGTSADVLDSPGLGSVEAISGPLVVTELDEGIGVRVRVAGAGVGGLLGELLAVSLLAVVLDSGNLVERHRGNESHNGKGSELHLFLIIPLITCI